LTLPRPNTGKPIRWRVYNWRMNRRKWKKNRRWEVSQAKHSYFSPDTTILAFFMAALLRAMAPELNSMRSDSTPWRDERKNSSGTPGVTECEEPGRYGNARNHANNLHCQYFMPTKHDLSFLRFGHFFSAKWCFGVIFALKFTFYGVKS